MEENIYKKIDLENDQTLVICDMSRKIGADAYVVRVKAKMDIEIKPELFTGPGFSKEEMTEIQLDDILSVLGDRIRYEYAVERNFIMADEKDAVFDKLVSTFMENLGQYVSKPQFPGKLVLKEYKDRTE